MGLNEDLDQLDRLIRQLQIEWEKFFAGVERRPPNDLQKRVEGLVRTHALRPALIPVITVMGMQIAMSLGGAVLTETTFEWKGLGFILVQYMSSRDYVAVQGIVIALAVIVAVTNFIVDVIAALVDPRVRY